MAKRNTKTEIKTNAKAEQATADVEIVETPEKVEKKKAFVSTDGILCRSVTPGSLFVDGPKSGMMYTLCAWVLANVPNRGCEGNFSSYEDAYFAAYKIHSENAGDEVRRQIKPHVETLFSEYNVAVQFGVKSHGKRGLRVVNLE